MERHRITFRPADSSGEPGLLKRVVAVLKSGIAAVWNKRQALGGLIIAAFGRGTRWVDAKVEQEEAKTEEIKAGVEARKDEIELDRERVHLERDKTEREDENEKYRLQTERVKVVMEFLTKLEDKGAILDPQLRELLGIPAGAASEERHITVGDSAKGVDEVGVDPGGGDDPAPDPDAEPD